MLIHCSSLGLKLPGSPIASVFPMPFCASCHTQWVLPGAQTTAATWLPRNSSGQKTSRAARLPPVLGPAKQRCFSNEEGSSRTRISGRAACHAGGGERRMNSSGTVANGIGQPVRRKEDFRLLTGRGSFADDVRRRNWRMP